LVPAAIGISRKLLLAAEWSEFGSVGFAETAGRRSADDLPQQQNSAGPTAPIFVAGAQLASVILRKMDGLQWLKRLAA
jgi:hypothetical protein